MISSSFYIQVRVFGKNWGICTVKKKLTAACQKARPSICIIHSNFLSVLSMWGKVRIANVIFLITYPTLNFQQKLGYLRSEEEANSSFRRLVRPFLSQWDKVRIANVICLFVTEEILYSITAVSNQGSQAKPLCYWFPNSQAGVIISPASTDGLTVLATCYRQYAKLVHYQTSYYTAHT